MTYTGDGVSGIYIYGGQLEQGSFPTSLIPTYGASASRSVDIVKVDGTAFDRFYNQKQGTVVADIQMPKGWKDGSGYALVWRTKGSGSNPRNILYANGPNAEYLVNLVVDGSAANQSVLFDTGNKIGSGEISRHASGFKTNDFGYSFDGETAMTDTSGTLLDNFTELNIGSRVGAGAMTGWFRRLRYFNKRRVAHNLQNYRVPRFFSTNTREPKQPTVLEV